MITMKEPEVNPSGRYSIEQTRRLLGIARSTLYEWERKGYISSHLHKHTLRRFYTGIDILRCWNAYI